MRCRDAAGKEASSSPFTLQLMVSNRPSRSGLAPTASFNLRRAGACACFRSGRNRQTFAANAAMAVPLMQNSPRCQHPPNIWCSSTSRADPATRHSLCYEDPLHRGLQGRQRWWRWIRNPPKWAPCRKPATVRSRACRVLCLPDQSGSILDVR